MTGSPPDHDESQPPMTDDGKSLLLSTRVRDVAGVTKRQAEQFTRLELKTLSDLLRYLPMRYETHAEETDIANLTEGTIGMARGVVTNCRVVRSGGGRRGRGGGGRFEATIEDHGGEVVGGRGGGRLALTWFNAGYLQGRISPGMTLRVQGKVASWQGYPQIVNPKWEALDDEELSDADRQGERLRPVYSATEKLPSRKIEALIERVLPVLLPQVVDPLPGELVTSHEMPKLADAFRMAHAPEHLEETKAARRRLAYNELLLLQLGIALKRHDTATRLIAPALTFNDAIDEHIRARFPFELTDAQDRVVREVAGDLARNRPMNRLLQGDVGSGKTVVALHAMLLAVADRKQAALMAPTELLAEQHYRSIQAMLAGSNVRMALLTAGMAASGSADRAELNRAIESGEIDIVIGTQALVQGGAMFKNLAVVIVDEQHRFGVLQRAAFRQAGAAEIDGRQPAPHCLVMTATPIPRTLSLTVFGDLDVSTIDKLPPGRGQIITRVVGENKSDDVYRYLATRVGRGEQAYVVVPAIDEGGGSGGGGGESAAQLKSVNAHAKLLADKYLSAYRVATVHGRLKSSTRDAVMEKFRQGKTDVLVATTVIEVGVDVANASVMIVEHAERFGLAQLHQLRGRVGRGGDGRQSLCVFIAEPNNDDAQSRLEAIAATTDGFKIAERDLEIRGMGDFFGTRQHGAAPLRTAKIPEDLDLLQLARRDAIAMIDEDPTLDDPSRHQLRQVLVRQYGDAIGLVDVG